MARRNIILAAAALVLLTCLAYLPVLNGGARYIWDDNTHVTDNAALHDTQGLIDLWAWGPRALFDKSTKPATQQYYPVTFTSFWLESQTWGLNPLGYHITNVLLHLLSAFLIWLILRHFGFSHGVAWFAAALFALHPVNVESVAWISERKNTLSLALYLAAAICWIRWNKLDNPPATNARFTRDFAWLFWAILLFSLALLAKSVTATLPVTLLLLAWWKRGRVRRIDFLGLLPLFAIALAAGALTTFIEARYIGAFGPDFAFGFPARCLIAGRAVWFYLASFLDPRQLLFIYPRWQLDPHVITQWIAPVAVLVVIAGLFALRKTLGRAPITIALLFIVALAPALGFINFYPMQFSFVADHFQYIAMIVLCVAAAALLAAMARRFHIPQALQITLAAVLLSGLGALTFHQSAMYRDEQTLYRTTLAANPHAWMASENLAVLLIAENPEKNYPEVLRLYQLTLQQNPHDTKARGALANTLLAMQRYADAEAAYKDALAANPTDVTLEAGLGASLLFENKFDAAAEHYAIAAARAPDDPEYLAGEGNALLHGGHPADAESRFRDAIALKTGSRALYHYYLGLALRDQGRLGPALESFHTSIQLDPSRPEPFVETADILARLHKDSLAVDYFQSALHVKSDYLPAKLDLARLLLISDEPGRADPVWAADLFRQADEQTHDQDLGIKIERAAALAAAKFYEQASDLLQQVIDSRNPHDMTVEDRERVLQLIQQYKLAMSPSDQSAGAPVVYPDENTIFLPYPRAKTDAPTTQPAIGYIPPP